jgi:hypothetical protein
MMEIMCREICPSCKGTGHAPSEGRFQTCMTCLKFGAHGYIEKWVKLTDLELSHELTLAIRQAFERQTQAH